VGIQPSHGQKTTHLIRGSMRFLIWALSSALVVIFVGCKRETKQRTADSNSSPAVSPEERQTSNQSSGERTNFPPHSYLELMVNNENSTKIAEVALIIAGRPCGFGIVGPGASAGYVGWTWPVGTNVLVRWRDSGSQKRESKVDISKAYDRDVPGELKFVLRNGIVTVGFRKVDRNP
jgi:hypothetical protein